MEEQCSPETRQMELEDCVEELLKFTLQSRLNGIHDFHLSLSKDFCQNLLRDDPKVNDSTGANLIPLYKELATALCESITCGELSGTCFKDSYTNQKESWNKFLKEKGCELANILKSVNFRLHVQEPFFTQLKDGLKTIEGRCAVGDYTRIKPGALILFNKCLVVEVKEVHHYASFLEMLEVECLNEVLPGINNREEGVKVYRKFYTEEKERSNGVIAIFVKKSVAQLYTALASILSELSYGGIQTLLGDFMSGAALKQSFNKE